MAELNELSYFPSFHERRQEFVLSGANPFLDVKSRESFDPEYYAYLSMMSTHLHRTAVLILISHCVRKCAPRRKWCLTFWDNKRTPIRSLSSLQLQEYRLFVKFSKQHSTPTTQIAPKIAFHSGKSATTASSDWGPASSISLVSTLADSPRRRGPKGTAS